MNHTTHHDGCECFTKKMAELESKLAKAREALVVLSMPKIEDAEDSMAWFEAMDAQYMSTELAYVAKVAREALKEIGTDRDNKGEIGT